MTLWLYLHFPNLQLDSLYAAPDAAIAIVNSHHNEVVQLSTAAQQQGVKNGMGLGTAAALCQQLQVYDYNIDVEKRRLREIAHWLYLLTADISFFAPDGILLKAAGMLRLYQGLDNYWQQLQSHLAALNVTYTYATGYSPLAARVLARTGANTITDTHNTLQQQLHQQALKATDLDHKSQQQLSRIGIHRLGELLTLPMAEISRRFPIDVVNYLGRITGQFKHPVNFYHPSERFSRHLPLWYDIENQQQLNKPLESLLKQLEQFLRLADKHAHELLLQLHLREGGQQELVVSSASGSYRACYWAERFALHLERTELTAPVAAITLKVQRLHKISAASGDLFSHQQNHTHAFELVSLLQAKLGKDAVKGICLTEDPRPHKASQYAEPLAPSPAFAANQNLLRPSILLGHPQPLTEKVKIIAGPERITTGWWDSQHISRDYFVARNQRGQTLWLYRNRRQQWFIQGMFC